MLGILFVGSSGWKCLPCMLRIFFRGWENIKMLWIYKFDHIQHDRSSLVLK